MDSRSSASATNRSRFQSPPSPTQQIQLNNNNHKASSPFGRFEFGAASKGTLADQSSTATAAAATTDTSGTNNFSLYSSSSSLNGRKSSPVPSESSTSPSFFDALMFEAMNTSEELNNNNHNASKNKVSKIRNVKGGRRSGRVPAKDQLHNYSFQSVDHWKSQRLNFDQFLSDRSKSSSSKYASDVVSDQFHKWEPFRTKIDGKDNLIASNNVDHVDADIEYSSSDIGSKGPGVRVQPNSVDLVIGIGGSGSKSFNGLENVSNLEIKEAEIGGFGSLGHGRGNRRKTFVFGASRLKSSVAAENTQEFKTDRVYAEFQPAAGSPQGLSNDGDYGSLGRPAMGRRSVMSESNSAGSNSMNNRQTPSIFISNIEGRFDSKARDKESVKREALVQQSVEDNQAATYGPQSREGTSWTFSSVDSSMLDDSSLQRGESSHCIDSPSNLNHIFEVGAKEEATKIHRGRRKTNTNNVPSSEAHPMGYQSHLLGGKLRDISPCRKTASENAPFNYHNMPDLKQPSVSCSSPLQPGDRNQYNFHQSDERTDGQEPMAANANLQTDIDRETKAEKFCKGELPIGGEHQFSFGSKDGEECNDHATSYKSNSPFERVKTDKCESGTNNTASRGGTQRRRSTSKPSFGAGPGSSASGFARSSHWPVVEGNAKKTSIEKFESSPFTLQPLVFQTDAVEMHALGSKGDVFDLNQVVDKEKITFGACDRSTPVPESTLVLPTQNAKSDPPAIPLVVKDATLEQACESWRHRGNQAYTEGEFSKAEEYYTRGISCVSPSETSKGCIRALALCYSNRAATRMAVSRLREALSDCKQAMKLYPNFLKAQIRTASCHLALGECELALAFFKDCLESQNDLKMVDAKLASEASEGIINAKQVDEKTDKAVRLLNTKKSEDVSSSLLLVNEALSISPHSEKLLELKAQALLSLCKFEEVIEACEEGLPSFNQNHYCGKSGSKYQMGNEEAHGSQCNCPTKLRLWQMTGKAQFYLGRLDEALALLLKCEEVNNTDAKSCGQRLETLAPLIATIRDLLHHKAAGNEAFQAGNFAEAEKHYTAALACNTESRPFTAICFCNRAAASQAQGHFADAIADCSRAMALDAKYLKAISRRSILHEIVRNYGQAISDLQRLITLQENEQQNVKGGALRRTASSWNRAQDLKDARERLAKAREEMKRGNPLDHYLILGVEPSSTAAEIKKAYRKAALKHHPDKAAQFLVRRDVGDDEGLKESGEEVRRDAEKLFQMIAEAYAILSDPAKRLSYDAEEELRKLQPASSSMAEPESQANNYQFEKNSRQHREEWDAWKDYENQYNQWKFRPEGFPPDNFTRQRPKNTSAGARRNDYNWDNI